LHRAAEAEISLAFPAAGESSAYVFIAGIAKPR